jgi:transposase
MAKCNASVSLSPKKAQRQMLTLTHPDAAGIDIGSASHYVAVPLIATTRR